MRGIMALVRGLEEDNETTDVEANPFADTAERNCGVPEPIPHDLDWDDLADTDVFWPPL